MGIYAIPKGLQPLGDGAGVALNIEWFTADPASDRSVTPDLVDQVLLHAATLDAVTAAMVQDAIAARLPAVELMLAPADEPPAAVRELLGSAVEGRAITSAVNARRGKATR